MQSAILTSLIARWWQTKCRLTLSYYHFIEVLVHQRCFEDGNWVRVVPICEGYCFKGYFTHLQSFWLCYSLPPVFPCVTVELSGKWHLWCETAIISFSVSNRITQKFTCNSSWWTLIGRSIKTTDRWCGWPCVVYITFFPNVMFHWEPLGPGSTSQSMFVDHSSLLKQDRLPRKSQKFRRSGLGKRRERRGLHPTFWSPVQSSICTLCWNSAYVFWPKGSCFTDWKLA